MKKFFKARIAPLFAITVLIAVIVFSMAACATPAPAPAPAPAAAPAPAPAAAPAPDPVQTSAVQRYNGIIIDGAQTYTVVSGDTLSKISQRFYGNGFYFPLIMLGSGDVVSDPDYILPGMRLTIPNLQRNINDSEAKARIKRSLGEIAAINSNRSRPLDAEGLRSLANSL